MSPSSMSSSAGVCVRDTLLPSKWKTTFFRAHGGKHDRYGVKTEPKAASYNTTGQLKVSNKCASNESQEVTQNQKLTLCRENSCEASRSLLCTLNLITPSSGVVLSAVTMTTHSAGEGEKKGFSHPECQDPEWERSKNEGWSRSPKMSVMPRPSSPTLES